MTLAGGAVTDLGTLTVHAPTPLPAGFKVNAASGWTVPRTVVNQPNTLKVPETCADPVPTFFEVHQNGQKMAFYQGSDKGITEGTATKQEDGTYTAEFTLPFAGAAEVISSTAVTAATSPSRSTSTRAVRP